MHVFDFSCLIIIQCLSVGPTKKRNIKKLKEGEENEEKETNSQLPILFFND